MLSNKTQKLFSEGVMIDRRGFCRGIVGGLGAAALGPVRLLGGEASGGKSAFKLRYILGSCMYGRLKLAEILPEVRKTHAEHIDIWPESHGNQREQMAKLGLEKFAALLREHKVKLGTISRYDLGPFRLQEEMRVARKLGGEALICGSGGPRGLKGEALKAAVGQFAEKMKPHLAVAEETGIRIGIENHGNSLIESPDSMRWLAEAAGSKHLGIALAPYHLPQDSKLIGGLIRDLGSRLVHIYAWQHGMGCHQKLPGDQIMLQLPGRGKLDFKPIVEALKKIDYRGFTEIFMHPVPRGTPIRPTAEQVTTEINRARFYLEKCLTQKGRI